MPIRVDPDGPQPEPLDLGGMGERAALRAYLRVGYRAVAVNWRCPLGEVDLVVARGDVLVFCEVKTRRGSMFGGPFDAVTVSKQRKLRRLATTFLSGPDGRRFDGASVRFDVASVTSVGSGGLQVELFEDAF